MLNTSTGTFRTLVFTILVLNASSTFLFENKLCKRSLLLVSCDF